MKSNTLIIIVLTAWVGFSTLDRYKDDFIKSDVAVFTDQKAGENSELESVKTEFKNIESKEDKILIYKLFSGSASYLSNSKFVGSTSDFDPILGKVQSSYGWNRDKYSSFTDAVSDYLISVNYQEPKQLENDNDRKEFAKIFIDLAEATKYE